MEYLMLNLFYLLLIILIIKKWVIGLKSAASFKEVILSQEIYLLMILIIIGFGPVLLLNMEFFVLTYDISPEIQFFLSVIMSLLISGVWLMYVRKIDIYEGEKWIYVIATFILGAIFSQLALVGYHILASNNIDLNGSIINDLIYCILAIGGIEETVKIIPFLLLLLFTKTVDEPYDYILYPSISALGFAFVENVHYIDSSSLFNIGGRALYATVAHMAFSSLVGYGMLLSKYHMKEKSQLKSFLVFFGLAMLAHGFYDFWLLNKFVNQFSILTTIFFLITIHVWFILKNNALNISNYYNPEIKLDNDQLKWYLVISLSSLLMLGYIMVSMIHGVSNGNQYLLKSWLAFGYLILYLTLSFSRYKITKGYMGELKLPMDFFIPKPIKKDQQSAVRTAK